MPWKSCVDPWNGLGMMLVEGFFVAQPKTRVRDGRIWNVEVLLLRTENLKVATSSNCLFPSWFVNARRSNTPFDVARLYVMLKISNSLNAIYV
jgi:hypothetical protein